MKAWLAHFPNIQYKEGAQCLFMITNTCAVDVEIK